MQRATLKVVVVVQLLLPFGGGGRLLQVDTFTAERYSPHWMNWVDTPARRPAARPANKTSPQKTHTKMATATHTRYRIVHT